MIDRSPDTTAQLPETLTIAAVQFTPTFGDIEGNLRSLEVLLQTVEADVVVLTELSTTGYTFKSREEAVDLSEGSDSGRFPDWVRRQAEEREAVICGGYLERAGDKLFNSSLTVLPDGRELHYRKSHLFYREEEIFEPGDTGFQVIEHRGVGYGVMICYDWRFPESARTLTLRGADVLLHPSNLVAAKKLWGPSMQARSFENRVFTATANRAGREIRGGEDLSFSGESQITDCNGDVLAVAGVTEDEVITATVDPRRARRKSFNGLNDILGDRRPELYER